jgi:hypothetical protein
MSEPTRQDDPAHIPSFEERTTEVRPRSGVRRRLTALGIVAAALLVPTTAAAAVAEHHRHHPHLTAALVVPTPDERYRLTRLA